MSLSCCFDESYTCCICFVGGVNAVPQKSGNNSVLQYLVWELSSGKTIGRQRSKLIALIVRKKKTKPTSINACEFLCLTKEIVGLIHKDFKPDLHKSLASNCTQHLQSVQFLPAFDYEWFHMQYAACTPSWGLCGPCVNVLKSVCSHLRFRLSAGWFDSLWAWGLCWLQNSIFFFSIFHLDADNQKKSAITFLKDSLLNTRQSFIQ